MNKKLIKELSANMSKDHISESSAQCSYYTILSFIPFIILLITMIQYTGIAPQTLFDAISKIIPSSMSEMVLGIVQEVYSKSIGTISVSIIFSLPPKSSTNLLKSSFASFLVAFKIASKIIINTTAIIKYSILFTTISILYYKKKRKSFYKLSISISGFEGFITSSTCSSSESSSYILESVSFTFILYSLLSSSSYPIKYTSSISS